MLLSKMGFYYNDSGKLLKKLVKDLKNSEHFVHVKCDKCYKKYKVKWNNRLNKKSELDLCNSCAKSGDKNSQYGKNRKEFVDYARSFVKNFSRVFSDETKSKMSKTRAKLISEGKINTSSFNRGVKSWYHSNKNNEDFYSDSKLEKFRMEQLDEDVKIKTWTKRHGIKIQYFYEDKEKYCVPDFLITTINNELIIEEVKGRITKIELIKKEAIEKYCIEHNIKFSFLTQKMLNKGGAYRKYLKENKNG